MNKAESESFYRSYYAFADMKKDFPWAKSIIICGYWYGKYKVPEDLKYNYGRSYLMDGRLEKDCAALIL